MSGGIEAPDWEEAGPSGAGSAAGGVIFVLENANLEVAKVGKNYELLNCDDHANFLRRHGKDPALHRPDICHQVRRSILLQVRVITWESCQGSFRHSQNGHAMLAVCAAALERT